MEAKELALKVCGVLSAKKATDILKIDVADKTIVADYYVICLLYTSPSPRDTR